MKDFRELKLDGVTRRFAHGEREVAALDGLTVTLRRGEFIALLGPSGCGKSTALNCIAGLLSLSAGGIWLDEQRIDTLPPEKRGFGMVFQNYALFPHMSVRQNVGFGLRMRGVPGTEIGERVARALDLVQLRGHEEKLPGQLSGGQQQRVAIARAIVVEPPLVLMDEPLSNLDARLRLEMRAEIRRIHRSLGRATIYVTHDQEEALSMADRIVVMKDGRVRQIGAPPAIYGEPADLDVARFMGYRNELAASVEHVAASEVMLSGGLRGRAMAPLAVGARVRAAIRPEDLALGGGPLAGRVENVEYGGRDSLVDVLLADGTRLHVRSSLPARLGEQVGITFSPRRLLVYPAA
ncbi:MAG TPA: ABC transporter ATP-binding protein [Burkholderiales bacterium]|nr:ABC transporter ATP-binding protein [Burkholderiales bacterium]